MLRLLVALFYAAWLVLTCINQRLFSFHERLIRLDIFRLIPVWTFFAPNPGVSDFNLLVRYRFTDGVITPFKEIPIRHPRTVYHLLFHPGQRREKALNDHIQTIGIHIEREPTAGNEQKIRLSNAYINLLYFCAQLPHPEEAAELQFAILESFGYIDAGEPRLLLNSEFHKL